MPRNEAASPHKDTNHHTRLCSYIGEVHADIMGPNGWSYISQLSKNERDIILDPYREDENYIGYNQKADKEARKILAKIISEL